MSAMTHFLPTADWYRFSGHGNCRRGGRVRPRRAGFAAVVVGAVELRVVAPRSGARRLADPWAQSLGQGTGRYVTGERKASDPTAAGPSVTARAGRRIMTDGCRAARPQAAGAGGTTRRRIPRPVAEKLRLAHLILV